MTNITQIQASVPGKIIISGEHAVVYGKPAIAAAVDRRLTVILNTRKDGKKIVNSEKQDKSGLIPAAIEILENKIKLKNRTHDRPSYFLNGYELRVKSEIPVGTGMGSSAAVAVAAAAAFTAAANGDPNLNLKEINDLAYEVEKKQHGSPSGIDNSIVTFGGLLWYRKEFEFLKTFWRLRFKVAKKMDNFYLINTGKPEENTGEMVALASSKLKAPPLIGRSPKRRQSSKPQQKTQKLLHGFEQVTKQIMLALREEEERSLMDGIKENQRLLEEIGVIGEFASKIVQKIEESGGAAKVSGAGGKKDRSGMLLVYHHDNTVVKKLAEKYKLDWFPAKMGARGVKIEKIKG